ncbi:MAG: anti-sigma-F factor Fin family protein [Firmicutes bacterium]|nr:anti-sigma-F factor Fin family protein [Bacillota bacterium]
MLIVWECSNCHQQIWLEAREDSPHVAALTAQAGDDIIEIDQAGNLRVRLLCEGCWEAAEQRDESEIVFLQKPMLH